MEPLHNDIFDVINNIYRTCYVIDRAGLKADGVCGKKTRDALKEIYMSR